MSQYVILDTKSLVIVTDDDGEPLTFDTHQEAEEYADETVQYYQIVYVS